MTNSRDRENGGPEMDRRGALECMVWNDEIVVTKPGTAFLLGTESPLRSRASF